jgi:hypothetical protein
MKREFSDIMPLLLFPGKAFFLCYIYIYKCRYQCEDITFDTLICSFILLV